LKAFQALLDLNALTNSDSTAKTLMSQILNPVLQKEMMLGRRPNALDKEQGLMELF